MQNTASLLLFAGSVALLVALGKRLARAVNMQFIAGTLAQLGTCATMCQLHLAQLAHLPLGDVPCASHLCQIRGSPWSTKFQASLGARA